MSLSEKANLIKDIVSLIVTMLPKFVDAVLEIITAIRELKTA